MLVERFQLYQLNTMYPQYGDSRFPADFGPGHAHTGVDSPGATGRYMYGPYYGSKGPDGIPFGAMNPSGSGIQSYSGKPAPVAVQDSVYASRWAAPGYMRASGPKPPSDYLYSGQVGSFVCDVVRDKLYNLAWKVVLQHSACHSKQLEQYSH